MIQKPKQNNLSYEKKEQHRVYSMISIVALVLALVVFSILFAREIIMSLKVYNPEQGIFSNPWVGFEHFKVLFSLHYFSRIIKNTVVFNLLFSGMFFTIGTLLGCAVMGLPRRGKEITAIFFALLVIMPTEVYSSWIIHLLSSPILANAGTMRFLYPLISTIKYLGIPIMVIYVRDEIYVDKDFFLPMKVAGLFSLATLAFISNGFFTMTNALYNPLTYETMDMLGTYKFRTGLIAERFSIAISVGVIQTLISIITVVVLFIPIRSLYKSIFRGERKIPSKDSIGGKLIFSIIALVIFALIYFLPYIVQGRSFDTGLLVIPLNLGYATASCIVLSIASALISTILAAMMSGAFVSSNKNFRIMAGVILVLITVLTINPVKISDYLLMKDFGMFNTVFAIIFSTCFSAAAVWAMVFILRSEHKLSVNSIFIAMIGLLIIQTAVIYGNSTPQMLYVVTSSASPLKIFKVLSTNMHLFGNVTDRASVYGVIGLYGFIVSLPPLLLFLLANILLPKDKLLAIICAGTKN